MAWRISFALLFFTLAVTCTGQSLLRRSNVPSYTITANTRAYYRLNNNKNDSSALGNHGQSDSAVIYTANSGRFTIGGTFNGIGSRVNLPDSARGWNDMTVSVWLRLDTILASAIPYTLGNTNSGAIRILNNLIGFTCGTSTLTNATTYSTRPITTGVWYNVVYSYSSGGGVFNGYINGDTAVTIARGGTQLYSSVTNTSGIGSYRGINRIASAFWNGSIDEVIIENRAWSQQDVVDYYNRARQQLFPPN